MTSVPEPGTAGILAIGLLGLAATRRRGRGPATRAAQGPACAGSRMRRAEAVRMDLLILSEPFHWRATPSLDALPPFMADLGAGKSLGTRVECFSCCERDLSLAEW